MTYFDLHTRSHECRRAGRLMQEGLSSSLGKVVEMSATGMSVVSRRHPPRELEVAIYSHIGTLIVRCRRIRLSTNGLFTYKIGLQFTGLDEQTSAIITRIARLHRHRRTM